MAKPIPLLERAEERSYQDRLFLTAKLSAEGRDDFSFHENGCQVR